MENSSSHFENPYNAFPADFRGRYYEIIEQDFGVFFEIYAASYEPEEIAHLKNLGAFEQSAIAEYIELVGEANIKPDTYHLYKLQVYKADYTIKDPWLFAESVIEYKQYGFIKFEDLMSFCFKGWEIKQKDFVYINQTLIP